MIKRRVMQIPVKIKSGLEAGKQEELKELKESRNSVIVSAFKSSPESKILNLSIRPIDWIEDLEINSFKIPPHIGSVHIEIETNDNIELEEIKEQKIPKVIIQTGENFVDSKEDYNLFNSVQTLIELNPEYEYKFFTYQERREFIKENFDNKVLEAYDILIPNAFKADLFRYCYLYQFGGCYFDYKTICVVPLRKIIKSDDTLLLCSDYDNQNTMSKSIVQGYLNSVIFAVPKMNIFLNAINNIVENIFVKKQIFLFDIDVRGYQGILDLTGPKLLYKSAVETVQQKELEEFTRFKHVIINYDETDYRNFQIKDIDSGKLLFYKTCTIKDNPYHYSKLWIRKELFYQNVRNIRNYTILVYPHNYPDIFEFELDNSFLKIKRSEGAWWLDLKIRMIDNITNDHYDIQVGRSGTNTKTIFLKQIKTLLNYNSILNNVFNENELDKVELKLEKNIIVVTSVINVSDNLMGKNEKRSVLTTEERFIETVEQLKQLKKLKADKNISILLLEASDVDKTQLHELSMNSDYIIKMNSAKCDYYCNKHVNKSLGEMQLVTNILKMLEKYDFEVFCKMSGRYSPNVKFDINPFLCDIPVCNVLKGAGRLGVIARTVFYSVPKLYCNLLKECFNVWLSLERSEPIEHIFTMFIDSVPKIKMLTSPIGITGKIAPTGDVFEM